MVHLKEKSTRAEEKLLLFFPRESAKANFSREQLSRWVTIANSDPGRRDTLYTNGDSLLFFYLRRCDLPDKRPWPYRKSRGGPARQNEKAKGSPDQAERKRSTWSRKGGVRRARPPHDFWLCFKATWQPDTEILTSSRWKTLDETVFEYM